MVQHASTLLDDDQASLIAFWIGPAHPFIASAYSVRDLWLGSTILSWLTNKAMKPIRDDHGPEVFLTPAVDAGDHPLPGRPNRFLAVIPDPSGGDEARRLAERSTESCRNAWKEQLSDKVHDLLRQQVNGNLAPTLSQNWDDLWEKQVSDFLHVVTATLAVGACNLAVLKGLLGDDWNSTRPDAEAWGRIELVLRLIDARKAAGHFPSYPIGERRVPQKCTLLGSYEQMGPSDPHASGRFWGEFAQKVHPGGTHVRKRERLCAVSLVKRFARVAGLDEHEGAPEDQGRAGFFPDTASVAAARWLDKGDVRLDPDHEHKTHKEGWSGQWLHWMKQNPEKDEDEERVPDDVWAKILRKRKGQGWPPAYYAILTMDADKMHRWLQGEMTPGAGPAVLEALSRTLGEFARELRAVVEDHDGVLIYSAADEALALLPADASLECAEDLHKLFAGKWNETPMPSIAPAPATLSAGIAVVHYKEDLRFALGQARRAEEEAKDRGGDAVTIAVIRRSGEHTRVTIPWELVSPIRQTFLEPFQVKASDRWLYALRAEAPALRALPRTAIRAEIGRLVEHASEETKLRIDPGAAVDLWQIYGDTMDQRPSASAPSDRSDLDDYVTLAQTMSFLTRGKD